MFLFFYIILLSKEMKRYQYCLSNGSFKIRKTNFVGLYFSFLFLPAYVPVCPVYSLYGWTLSGKAETSKKILKTSNLYSYEPS